MRTIVRRALSGFAVVGATALVPASTQAVNCHSFRCVNRTLNRLQKQVKSDTRALNILLGCLKEAPLTQYGDGLSHTFGYRWHPSSGADFNTTAIDATSAGGHIGAWMLADGCNNTTTAIAVAKTAHAVGSDARTIGSLSPFAPIAPQAPLFVSTAR